MICVISLAGNFAYRIISEMLCRKPGKCQVLGIRYWVLVSGTQFTALWVIFRNDLPGALARGLRQRGCWLDQDRGMDGANRKPQDGAIDTYQEGESGTLSFLTDARRESGVFIRWWLRWGKKCC